MLEISLSGKREAQNQKQEDVLLRVLPLLRDGLALESVPDFQVGCYMILAMMATKISFAKKTSKALMESIVSHWKQTSHAGLICLVIFAEQTATVELPKQVFKALMALKSLEDDLVTLRTEYKVNKFVLGILTSIVKRVSKSKNDSSLLIYQRLIQAELLEPSNAATLVNEIISEAKAQTADNAKDQTVQGKLSKLLNPLMHSERLGSEVQNIIGNSDVDLEGLELESKAVISTEKENEALEVEAMDIDKPQQLLATENVHVLLNHIPTRTVNEISFLSDNESHLFPQLAEAFVLASSSVADVKAFSDLPILRKTLATQEPLFLSFFARMWTENHPPNVKSSAITTVSDCLSHEMDISDVQFLLPYVIYGLADPSAKVRHASTELVIILDHRYDQIIQGAEAKQPQTILGSDNLYSQREDKGRLYILSKEQVSRILKILLLPLLEDCALDSTVVSKHLTNAFNGSSNSAESNGTGKTLKSSVRAAFFRFLCSHVIEAPMYGFKLRLLQILNSVLKAGDAPRTRLLMPLLSNCLTSSLDNFVEKCHTAGVAADQMMDQVVGIVAPADREGVKTLHTIISTDLVKTDLILYSAAIRRIKSIWTSLKPDAQLSLSSALLEQCQNEQTGTKQEEAAGLLRKLNIPTAVLEAFVEELSGLLSNIDLQSPTNKRRKTHGGQSLVLDVTNSWKIRQLTQKTAFVLELIESSKPENHPSLLKKLFQLITDMQQLSSNLGEELSYLQLIAMSIALAIIQRNQVEITMIACFPKANLFRGPKTGRLTARTYRLMFWSSASGLQKAISCNTRHCY